jgi:hyperosmotically inducible periplasmic protein
VAVAGCGLVKEVFMRTRQTWLGLALAAFVAVPAWADTTDVWLTTRAKIALLTTDGISVTGVNVDTVDGAVTLHGKVKTQVEKEKATLAVGTVEGVKSVNNLLQVVPDAFKASVKANDDAIKNGVEGALKLDKRVEGVKVASVNNGVVLLSGRAATLAEKLRAIELAWNVGGVSRVASEIETGDN